MQLRKHYYITYETKLVNNKGTNNESKVPKDTGLELQ